MGTNSLVRGSLATLLLAVCAAITPPLGCGAEPTADGKPEKSLAETAQHTYELLLNDYRSGRTTGPLHLELLNRWSQRILLAQIESASMFPGLESVEDQAAIPEEHLRRMAELEAIVRALAEAGRATAAEVAATRFYHIEARSLVVQLEQKRRFDEDRELEIVLPPASEAEPLVVEPRELFLHISHDGRYLVSGEEVDSQQMEALLRQAVAANPASLSVIIRADKRCLWEHVVRLMDLCNKVGIRDYRVTTANE